MKSSKCFFLLLLALLCHTGLAENIRPDRNQLVQNRQTEKLVFQQSDFDWSVPVEGSYANQAPLVSLQAVQLMLLVVTCFLSIFTFYKFNKERAYLLDRIESISLSIDKLEEKSTYMNNAATEVTNHPVNEKKPIIMKTRDAKWLESLNEIVNDELSNSLIKPVDLATKMGICERQLQRKLKKIMGVSPTQYLNEVRLKRGYEYLESGNFQTISEVAYKVGFKYPDYFSKSFKKFFGIKPNELLNSMTML